MSNIHYLAEELGDASLWSPEQMLNAAIRDIGGKYGKAVVLLLDDSAGEYDTRFLQSGMSASEIVSLLEIFKLRIINEIM